MKTSLFYEKNRHLTRDSYFLLPIFVVFLMGISITEARIVTVTIFAYFMFVLPGFLFLKTIQAPTLKSLIYGAPLGLGIVSLFVMVEVSFIGWGIFSVLSVYFILLFALPGIAHKIAQTNRYNFFTDKLINGKTNYVPFSVFFFILIYLIIIFIPLTKVGTITPDGYAFTSLFSHDYILRGIASVSLANNIPPDNYYINGFKSCNYYYLWYVLPATIYNVIGQNGNIRDVIAILCLLNALFFCLLIYYTIVDFIIVNGEDIGKKLDYRKLTCIFVLILFCYSYHWMYFVIKQAVILFDINSLIHLTNQMNLLSQSWFRNILFEPQLILALMMILLALGFMSSEPSFLRGAIIGVILSMIALTDTPVFLIFGATYFLYCATKALIGGNSKCFIDIFGTISFGIVIAAVMFLIRIFTIPQYSNAIIIEPYVAVIASLPLFLILHYGAMPITSLLGIKGKPNNNNSVLMLMLTFVSMFFMLFVTETLEHNVFLRKSLYVLRLPLCLFTGYYLYHAIPRSTYKILVILLIISFPTCLTDVYVTSNVTNRDRTTYISQAEMEAALWLKKNTVLDI